MLTPLRLALLGTALALPAAAQDSFDPAQMTPAQQQAFGQAVREYLLENPQVIMDAVAVLQEREAQQAAQADVALIETYEQALMDDGFSWVGGNPDGDITIVEFLDYRCGYCRRAHPELTELIASDGNIRLIVKEYPILGEASEISSRFAIATMITAGAEAYKSVHDALIALNGAPTDASLQRIAGTLGLDADAIMAEMQSDEVNRRILQTRALGQNLQINGTPSFVMGSQMVRGFVPLDGMREIIAAERG